MYLFPIYLVTAFIIAQVFFFLLRKTISNFRLTDAFQVNRFILALDKLHELEDNLKAADLPEKYSGVLIGCFTVQEAHLLKQNINHDLHEVKVKFSEGTITADAFEESLDDLLTRSNVLKVNLPPRQ